MSKCSFINDFASLLMSAAVLLGGRTVTAEELPPLQTFLKAAADHSFDQQESHLLWVQRKEEQRQALARLFPSASAVASYTRNQYQIEVQLPGMAPGSSGISAVITPQNQLSAALSLSVPLIDAGAWQRLRATRASTTAAQARSESTGLEVKKTVARTYYQYVGAVALVAATERALAAAVENAQAVNRRVEAGLASDLDRERATADCERAAQSKAEAQLSRDLASRQLETLTGILPVGEVPALHALQARESPLADWERSVESLPTVRAAIAELNVAQQNATAARLGYLPTASGTISENLTNAAGFGQNASWSAGVRLELRVDGATAFGARASDALAAQAAVRLKRARREAADQIVNSWRQVLSNMTRSRAATAQAKASEHAAVLAKSRYAAGTATQLEVIQADRDAFSAEVARIQADADLIYSRVLLRLVTGLPESELLESRSEPGSGSGGAS